MNMETLWNTDEPASDYFLNDFDHLEVPAWIDPKITAANIASIIQGGCASGAYMPAVTYYEASQTMAAHGDDVLQFIEDAYGEVPSPPSNSSWSGHACFFLSTAVELWASSIEDELTQAIDEAATILD